MAVGAKQTVTQIAIRIEESFTGCFPVINRVPVRQFLERDDF
jgi:hypothetical protein